MVGIQNCKEIVCFIILGFVFGCVQSPGNRIIVVKNKLNIKRVSETVEIPLAELHIKGTSNLPCWSVKDAETGEYHPTEWIDQDRDGIKDALIFHVNMKPLSVKKYQLVEKESNWHIDSTKTTYSRFVPERIDDYAWENDRVAYRTYGPKAERLVKEHKPGGTLSSGMDCWFKRVSYPIINKWYKKYTDGTGSYHVDSGEGFDNYNVNGGRGCGGIGIRINDSLYVSDNFVSHKTWETGPIRTSFELSYAPWDAAGTIIHEKKEISLDLGSNLSRVEEIIDPPYPENIVAGLAIHPQGGFVTINEKSGWCSYWALHGDSELGVGIVADPKYIAEMTEYRVNKTDKSHLFFHLKPVNGKIIYYTGFGWKKSGQFETRQQWENYLSEFAARLASPLEVKIQ